MSEVTVQGTEHWTRKGDVRLFLWRKSAASRGARGTILFVHGSSMASQPTFDLHVPGRPDSSAMDWFAARGFDTWCMDNEGYGRSDKTAPDQLRHRERRRRPRRRHRVHPAGRPARRAARLRHLLGRAEGGALRRSAIRSASRASRSMPSCGPARAARRSPSGARSCRSSRRRTAARSTAPSCTASSSATIRAPPTRRPIEAFADAILALDDSVPTGTYVDMCSKLPLVDPAKITVPTIVMRGEYDGIAGFDDLIEFFKRAAQSRQAVHGDGRHLARELPAEELPCVYHILHAFFTQPEPVYRA